MPIGPLMLDLGGLELAPLERELLQHPLVAGVILFTRNYESVEQLTELISTIRQARDTPLLIAVDQEGGRVIRFKSTFTQLPSMGQIGQLYDQFPKTALQIAEHCGWLMASELFSVGIDMSFAPVLDLNKGINPAIQDRAFHRSPDKVILLATALIKGMQAIGMAATGKHFPGHGSITIDSHLALPVDLRTFEMVQAEDLRPFQALISSGLQAIMPAHIIFSAVDDRPVGFSAKWLQALLRKELHFTGTIVSDDLNMKGAAAMIGPPADRAQMALDAGCDIILMCNNPVGAIHILDHLPRHYFLTDAKLKSLQGKPFMSFKELIKTHEWRAKHKSLAQNGNIVHTDF